MCAPAVGSREATVAPGGTCAHSAARGGPAGARLGSGVPGACGKVVGAVAARALGFPAVRSREAARPGLLISAMGTTTTLP